MSTTKIFTGYQVGNLNGTVTYKCWFKNVDKNGFEYKEVKYLSAKEFAELPKVGEEAK